MNNQNFLLWETIQRIATNIQQLTLNTSQGEGKTPAPDGTFGDGVGLWFPETPPQPGQFAKVKQFLTLTNKLKSYDNLRINCHNFQWNADTVTDVTRTPNASCQ